MPPTQHLTAAARVWSCTSRRTIGRPQPTETVLSLSLSLVPVDGDSWRVAFDDARTGGRIGKVTLPHIPHEVVTRRETGVVVVRAAYDADGKVVSATLDDESPLKAREVVKASLDAVRQWTFEPERVAGHGVAGIQIVPVCYTSFVGYPRPGDEAATCAWKPHGQNATIAEGESLSLDPAARLTTAIGGHAL